MQISLAKNIIITGANKGVGYGILENLAQKPESHQFILAIRSVERGQEAVEQLSKLVPNIKDRVTMQELDISDRKSIDSFVDWISKTYGKGKIDCLINNAGMAFKGDRFDDEVVKITFNTNYWGTAEFADKMKPYIADNGKIINITSSAGKFKNLKSQDLVKEFDSDSIDRDTLNALATRFYDDVKNGVWEQNGWPKAGYAMSKVCANVYSRILARDEDIVSRNIQVYACCPGWVRTDMAGDKATRSIQEGALCPVATFDFPWTIDQTKQGKFFYDGIVTPLL